MSGQEEQQLEEKNEVLIELKPFFQLLFSSPGSLRMWPVRRKTVRS